MSYSTLTRALSALALIAIMALPAIAALVPARAEPYAWEAKVDPLLAKKLKSMDPDDQVVVVVRLKPLPPDVAEAVRGHYKAAVAALKAWADRTQQPVVGFIAANGGVVLHRFWLDNVILVRAPVWLVKILALDPSVIRIFPNFKVHVVEPTEKHKVEVAPGQEVSSWGVFKIRAPDAWAEGYTGEGVRIAVLDTGVDVTHPALQGKMLTLDPSDPHYPGGWMEWDENGNPVCSEPHDTHGHGTHTSGTALGGDTQDVLIGVAPGATLMHGLVLPGGGGSLAQVLAGMEWTVDPYDCNGNPTGLPAHVVSMSWGATGYYDNDLLPAIENMLLANIIPVAAIGNDGPGTSSNPGNIWGVFGVGATDINDDVASWSSGEVVNWPSPPSEWPFFDTYPSTYVKPDFSAPGVDITSAVPGGGYEAWSGTSMATPHVSGTVALILQAMGVLDYSLEDLPELVYQILNQTSIDFGDPGQDTRYGWGRIDAYEAVKLAEQYAKPTGVEGYVYDAVNNQPIPWATVTVVEVNKTVSVNNEGYFKIPLDPGNYTLLFEAWGYQPKTIQVEVKILNGTIAGIVQDAQTGDPIPGATVTVVELDITVTTDSQGAFQVSVPPGTYTLTAAAEDYRPENQTVSVGENETVFVVFNLYPAANGTIAGHVYDAETGDPIANALVWTYVEGEPVYNYTDSQGYYELNVPAGTYTVYARANGYAQAQQDNVTVQPEQVTVVDFYLEPIPPSVVVLGNVHYYTQPHIAAVLEQAGIPNVLVYDDVEQLIADWQAGEINPIVVVIDHWKSNRYTLPSLENVTTLIGLAELNGARLVILGTYYSGYTGIDVLYEYSDDLEQLGYPAPDSYLSGWPSPEYVIVDVLDPTHAIFENVTYDGDTWFYLADIYQSDYADYIVYNFTDDNVTVLAWVNDTYNGRDGVGVATWISPYSGATWIFLGSWAESYWMQYQEPGSDGLYSESATQVLVNAVRYAMNMVPDSTGHAAPRGDVGRVLRILAGLNEEPRPGADVYTYVEVYLDRQPYGYVTGRVVDAQGNPVPGARVEAVGTPMSTEAGADGGFLMWLPEGTYTIRVTAQGYYPKEVRVTVSAGATVNLGNVQLKRQLRAALLYDYQGFLAQQLAAAGFYAKDYTDLTGLTQDLATGFYDVVVYAGYYGVPFPSSSEFQAFLEAAESAGVGVVWMDSWGDYGYGVKVLSAYTGDPASVGYDYGVGQVYVRIEQSHVVVRGYGPGEHVMIVDYTDADFSWFNGFSGVVVASTVVAGNVYGASIGVKVTEAGNKWVLLSSFAPTQWNRPEYFTEDALGIIVNAVKFAATKPLNVTLTPSAAHVGDTVSVHVAGAPRGVRVNVYFDGVLIGRKIATGPEGAIDVQFVVPVVPGGAHLVEATTEDGVYYGSATLAILPKLTVAPSEAVTPAAVHLRATGLPAGQHIKIAVDLNVVGEVVANGAGVVDGTLNLPLLPTGGHTIRLLAEDGRVIAEAAFHAVNGLESLNESIESIRGYIEAVEANLTLVIKAGDQEILAKLDEVNATIVGVVEGEAGELYALVNTTYGLLAAKLDAVNASLAGLIVNAEGELSAVIDTAMGTLQASLDQAKAEIEALVSDKAGELALLVTSAYGNVTVALDSINASIADVISSLDGLYALVQAGHQEILVKVDAVLEVLQQVNASIVDVVRGESGRVYALVETAYNDILVSLDQLNASIAGLVKDEAGKLYALIDTGLGEVEAGLDQLNAKVAGLGENLTVTIETAVGTVTASLEDVNASIAGVIADAKGELLAVIQTAYGNLTARLDEINASIVGVVKGESGKLYAEIKTGVGDVLASLDQLNATLVGLVRDESGSVKALINTSLGVVNATLDQLNATLAKLVATKTGEVIAVINTSYGQISAKLDDIAGQLPAMKSELEAKTAEAKTRANQAAAVGSAGTALGLAALALGVMLRRRLV